MGEWPKRLHPAHPDADGDGVEADTTVTVEAFQMQPGTWDALAAWCGGTRILDDTGNQAVAVRSLSRVARLGDFVLLRAGKYTVEPADGFYQRFVPIQP